MTGIFLPKGRNLKNLVEGKNIKTLGLLFADKKHFKVSFHSETLRWAIFSHRVKFAQTPDLCNLTYFGRKLIGDAIYQIPSL